MRERRGVTTSVDSKELQEQKFNRRRSIASSPAHPSAVSHDARATALKAPNHSIIALSLYPKLFTPPSTHFSLLLTGTKLESCSGYHVCLTYRRSPVQFRVRPLFAIFAKANPHDFLLFVFCSIFFSLFFFFFFTGNRRCTDRTPQAQKTKTTMAAVICM